jgi:hypothetical protein
MKWFFSLTRPRPIFSFFFFDFIESARLRVGRTTSFVEGARALHGKKKVLIIDLFLPSSDISTRNTSESVLQHQTAAAPHTHSRRSKRYIYMNMLFYEERERCCTTLHNRFRLSSQFLQLYTLLQQQKPFSTVSHLTIAQQSRAQSSGSLLALNYRSNLYIERETLIKKEEWWNNPLPTTRLPDRKSVYKLQTRRAHRQRSRLATHQTSDYLDGCKKEKEREKGNVKKLFLLLRICVLCLMIWSLSFCYLLRAHSYCIVPFCTCYKRTTHTRSPFSKFCSISIRISYVAAARQGTARHGTVPDVTRVVSRE